MRETETDLILITGALTCLGKEEVTKHYGWKLYTNAIITQNTCL